LIFSSAMNLSIQTSNNHYKSNRLVSCLCVSHNSFNLLKTAIDCFLAQTYENKELIIVYHKNNHITHDIIQRYSNDNIIFFEEDPGQQKTLGELRNKSIDICSGHYICIWDDDDWHHEKRLELQVKALEDNHKAACVLTNLLIFDGKNCEAYYSHTRPWEGTLLCKKKVFTKKIRYVPVEIDEDSPLLDKLLSQNLIFPLVIPTLYIYVFHGANTWAQEHFEMNMQRSQKLSNQFSLLLNDILLKKITTQQGSEELLSSKYLQEINYLVHPQPIPFTFLLTSKISLVST
jgi:glycosyltransferase involved in cell wall biosynthesis